MKSARQEKILEIIERYDIETQNQLMEHLRAEGVKSTQATLSRDIRDLHLVKEQSPSGVYRYVTGVKDGYSDYDTRLRKIFRESVLSYAVAQNLLVIRTLPGLAGAACSALDSMSIPSLVGSIAGDDTAFIAMKDNAAAEHFYKEIANLL
ncbi:MAG: arginine repressor [Butyricicoccus sp.]|nr:arginine repressor [Butyricicoccus sp.]